MHNTMGVDISKERLDAYALAGSEHRSFANDASGQRALRGWAGRLGVSLVVFEATGRYHRAFERGLAAAGMAYTCADPRRARRFVEALGQTAKTDRADAAALARMGAALDLAADRPKPEVLHVLNDLLTARAGLVKDRTAAKTRHQATVVALIRRQQDARLKQIATQMKSIDRKIDTLIARDPQLSRRREILATIPGIGAQSAALLVIAMPELGSIDAKAASSLAGLAPITRQSGRWQGQSHIGGGRAKVRSGLYMPTLSAIKHNPDLNAFHRRLIARGKRPKLAITATMRKLITLANALLRDDREWTPTHA